jgi:CheY-like chemotaxis protein
VFLIDRRPDGLYQIRAENPLPTFAGSDEPVLLQLSPKGGLVPPEWSPARRESDRQTGPADRILLLSLVKPGTLELETWATRSFDTDIVRDPLDALASLQKGRGYGGVLIHSPGKGMREAVRTCRAMRPLTGAAIIVASDDAVRSADRVALLDAGADDCLSGGIDFQELGARIRKAVAAGGQPAPSPDAEPTESEELFGGLVVPEVFAKEARRRSARPNQCVFSVVHVRAGPVPPSKLGEMLADQVREDDGDLVARVPDGCLVLLQGARREPTKAFLARARREIERRLGWDPHPSFRVLVSPADKLRIDILLGRSEDSEELSAALGGMGGQGA